jgi:carbamoyl-phosphate synthase small subunit
LEVRLLLEDGTLFTGSPFGAEGFTIGEIVFNTSMTGYQEILTDPSYFGQIITMTYPLIGNYGLSHDDYESLRPYARGLVVREYAEYFSHWRNKNSLAAFLKEHQIIGISEIDTRRLTRKIRLHGTMKAILTTGNESLLELKEQLVAPLSTDQVARCSTKDIHISPNFGKKRVVLVDFGVKLNIHRELVRRNCEVILVPYDTTAGEILQFHPDGVILSNGPGDPKDVSQTIHTIKTLLGKVPIFGICLGHQLFALACGADTEKLKFGHRGGNHPVQELASNRTVITSQNHGFTVTSSSVEGTLLKITHISLHDGTVEGLEHKEASAFSVQYHPESAPGPLDSGYLFDRFYRLMDKNIRKEETQCQEILR